MLYLRTGIDDSFCVSTTSGTKYFTRSNSVFFLVEFRLIYIFFTLSNSQFSVCTNSNLLSCKVQVNPKVRESKQRDGAFPLTNAPNVKSQENLLIFMFT